MKPITLFSTAFLLGLALSLNAQNGTKDVNWLTWQEAVNAMKKDAKAGKSEKKMMIFLYTDWCAFCSKMESATFKEKNVAEYINKNFYPVKFDAETREVINYKDISFKYVEGKGKGKKGVHQLAYSLLDGDLTYPSVVFLNQNFEIEQRMKGNIDARKFYLILSYLSSNQYGVVPFQEYEKAFKSLDEQMEEYKQSKPRNPNAVIVKN